MSKDFLLEQVDLDTWQITFYEDGEEVAKSLFGSQEEATIAGQAFLNDYDNFLPWDE